MFRHMEITSPSMSGRVRRLWEEVMEEFCSPQVREEYRDLDEGSKSLMVSALESSVKSIVAQCMMRSALGKRGEARQRRAACSLSTALQASGVTTTGDIPDDLWEYFQYEFLGKWGVPLPSEHLIMKHLVKAEQAVALRKTTKKADVFITTTSKSVVKASQDSSWQSLQSINIRDLQLFRTMKGKRLECKVAGPPNFAVGITTVLQDATGDAVQCGIYNLPSVCDVASAEAALPEGSTIVIAEPFLKIMADGMRGVRVDIPSELQIFMPGQRPIVRLDLGILGGETGSRKHQCAEEHVHRGSAGVEELLEGNLVPGARVRLKGLTSKKGLTLNSKLGVVVDAKDPDDFERIAVEVDSESGEPNVVKVKPANLEVVSMHSLEDVHTIRADANRAFEGGDLQSAVEGYSRAISLLSAMHTPQAMLELSKCLCNRALCYLRWKQWDEAGVDARACLEKDPTNLKAQFRRASALFREGVVSNQDDVSLAAVHACSALALARGQIGHSTAQYRSMEDLLMKISSISEQYVPNTEGIACVRTSAELRSTLESKHARFVVVCPGQYHFSEHTPIFIRHDVKIVGLGSPTFLKDTMHVMCIISGRVQLEQIRITDARQYALGYGVFSVGGETAWLTLSSCVVEDVREVVVCVANAGRCSIEQCEFRKIGRQVIEVREQGQAEIRHSNFRNVHQGVCAYGGARSVSLEGVVIDGAFNEGVMASGEMRNQETLAQESRIPDRTSEGGTPGFRDQSAAKARGMWTSLRSRLLAEECDWNGRLVLSMTDCTIRHTRGMACSIDEGCAAFVTRCTMEKSTQHEARGWPGIGVLVKGESDVVISACRFIGNDVGVQVGYNYAGKVVVESSVFACNRFKDILEDTAGSTAKTIASIPKYSPAANKLRREMDMLQSVGAWSTPLQQSQNQFLSKGVRIPEITELAAKSKSSTSGSDHPLPQKLAWEAAGRGRYSLVNACICGFSCTELGNSSECTQPALRNHVDFPPFMCMPASERLADKQDDPNAQFYFRPPQKDAESSRQPFRHWCLVGEILSIEKARGADAASFAVLAGEDAVKIIKLRTKFADQLQADGDVDVLMMVDHPLANGSSPLSAGNTLALLYPEACDVDITKGSGQVAMTDASLAFVFAGPLQQLLDDAQGCASVEEGSDMCGCCGHGVGAGSRCAGCNLVSYCSDRCASRHARTHKSLCPQMGMVQRLASSDFRAYERPFSFVDWAAEVELTRPAELLASISEVLGNEHEAELVAKGETCEATPSLVPSVDELCARFDTAVASSDPNAVLDAIRGIEEALKETCSDGSFKIGKSGGRSRLQNKLKRAKTRSVGAEKEEVAPEACSNKDQSSSAPIDAPPEYAEETATTTLPAGHGPLDGDGYHGILALPKRNQWSQYLPSCARSAHHVFVSYPCNVERPSKPWCIDVRPATFCADFRELVRCPDRARVLSCWGHDQNRPGHQIPSAVDTKRRLWKVRPSEITFSQDSIAQKFTDGNTLEGTLGKLRSGECKVQDIERIQITWHSHGRASAGTPCWWSYTGNRRLYLFQQLERDGKIDSIVAECVTEHVPEWRVTTAKAGDVPRLRRGHPPRELRAGW
mmetsp:Transcript_166252/g.533859  ORF Transcript_166252/g.533859 Transcript_166252/m.533859 type:complete len:1592 (-) Transcript_166252:284-5059(-)